MHNILFVAVIDGLNNLLENIRCLEFSETFFIQDHIEKFTSLAELSNQVNVFGIFEILKEFEDVRMVQCLENLDLVFIPLTVLDFFPRNRFAGSYLFGNLMHNSMDYAVCA